MRNGQAFLGLSIAGLAFGCVVLLAPAPFGIAGRFGIWVAGMAALTLRLFLRSN